jgi:hypothetical protein
MNEEEGIKTTNKIFKCDQKVIKIVSFSMLNP